MHSIAKSSSLVNTIKEKMYVEYKDTLTYQFYYKILRSYFAVMSSMSFYEIYLHFFHIYLAIDTLFSVFAQSNV